jgi:site-specific recombinase XerD
VFDLVRAAQRRALPVVLSVAEVHLLLRLVRDRRARMAVTTIYSCGLRLMEGLGLATRDIDSARMVVHVRGGKGGRDRYVPLPERTLLLLRDYWRAYGQDLRRAHGGPPPARGPWLFPNRAATGPLGHKSPATTAVYTHITPAVTSALHTTVNSLMATL